MATITILRCDSLQPQKIQAIKLVREVTSLGLKEAKDLVELLPQTFNLDEARYNANAVVNTLTSYGYTSEIVGDNSNLNQSQQVEVAFRNLLITLINAGDYDEVVNYIKFKKKENTGRRLETL